MSKIYRFFSLLFFSIIYFLNTQAQQHIWSKSIGNDTRDQFCAGMTLDKLNNVIITGNYEGAIDLGGGFSLPTSDTNDVFLIKHNKDGNLLWAKGFGKTGVQKGEDVVTDKDNNIIVVGNFADSINFGGTTLKSNGVEDIFIAKFDATGNHLWSKSFGDALSQKAIKVAVDVSGNIYFSGNFRGSFDFGNGLLTGGSLGNIFIVSFDPNGNSIWSKEFGDGFPLSVTGLTIDKNSNILLSGWFTSTIDFGGGQITATGAPDIFLTKFTSAGTHIWSTGYFGPGSQNQLKITTDKDNNIILTGVYSGKMNFGNFTITSKGASDIFLAKLNPDGTNFFWVKSFGSQANEYSRNLATDTIGNIYLTGYFFYLLDLGGGMVLQSAGNNDIFMAKFDANGNYIWSKNFGDANNVQKGENIVVDEQGNFFASGTFAGVVNFGGKDYMAPTNIDNIYLVRFDHYHPEILVREQQKIISNAGVYAMENTAVNNASNPILFTIENTGTEVLTLSGNPKINISGVNAVDFTINESTTASALSPGNSTVFSIVFAPSAAEKREALITIQNNDENENPFIFSIQGTGINPNGINEDPNKDILISPNPSTGKFQVFIPETNGKETEITVSDIIGQKVWQSKTKNSSSYFTVDLSDKPKGIYFLELRFAEKSKSTKLIVK